MAERFTQITCEYSTKYDSLSLETGTSTEETIDSKCEGDFTFESNSVSRTESINETKMEIAAVLDVTSLKPEIGRVLCRIMIFRGGKYGEDMQSGDYGGYRKDILTENLTERDKAVLICNVCNGIMNL